MTKKNILLISRSFYPINSPRSFRATELAVELAKQGNKVTVLLPGNSKTADLENFATKNNLALAFYQPLVWSTFSKTSLLGNLSNKINRLLFLLFEYPNIEIFFKLPLYLKKIKKQYDLLITIAVPHENHWAVAKFQKNKKIAKAWIADCGDPFMGNKLESIRAPFYFNRLENNFLKNADFITVPTSGAINAYNALYRNKFRVIPQGFNFDANEIAEYKTNPNKVIFAYAGGVAPTGIRSLNEFINYLLTKEEIDFEFHVFSKNINILEQFVAKSKGKIVLHNSIPRSELLFELSKMDFLVNLDNGMSTASPSKLIDYKLTKRPILNILPNNINKDLVDEFLNKNYTNQFLFENIDDYNIVNVANNFLKLGDEVI